VAITLCGPAFQQVHLASGLVTLLTRSCNPAVQARRFRLFRFRSPRIRRRFGFGYRISASWCLPCSRPESLRPRSSCASVTIPLCEPACRPLKSPVAWFFPGTPVARRSAEASVARRFLKFVSALWRPRLPGVPSIRRSVCNSGCPWLLSFRLRFFLDVGCPLPLNRRSGSPWTPVARCPRSPFPMLLKPRLPGAS